LLNFAFNKSTNNSCQQIRILNVKEMIKKKSKSFKRSKHNKSFLV
jgi:hypothetical protein